MDALSHSFDHPPAHVAGRQSSQVFERLYEDLHVRIYNLAARVLGDVDEAADVTQDVFLKTFRELPGLPRDADMERWTYRVTVNACYDVLRRRRTRATSSLHDLAEIPDSGDGQERARLAHAVETALADLSPRYRTVLVLKDLHGLGNSEVAEIMGISRGTAGVLLFRARAAFRRAFVQTPPAGARTAAGLGLAALLPVLPVPAFLQAPPFVAPVGAAPAAPGSMPEAGPPPVGAAPAAWGSLASRGGAPTATIVLAKIGAAISAKVVLVAVGASVVAGGGLAGHMTGPSGGGAATASPGVAAPASAALTAPGAGTRARNGRYAARHRLQSAEKPRGPAEPHPSRLATGGTLGGGGQTGASKGGAQTAASAGGVPRPAGGTGSAQRVGSFGGAATPGAGSGSTAAASTAGSPAGSPAASTAGPGPGDWRSGDAGAGGMAGGPGADSGNGGRP